MVNDQHIQESTDDCMVKGQHILGYLTIYQIVISR